jgi:hypothetical protein
MFGATAQEQEEREIKEIKTTKRTIDVTYTEE